MTRLKQWLVWLSRIHRCRGFGIQSPTDYAFVRYVVNEHWPYYAYDELHEADRIREKKGRLYFRLSNWRQPSLMQADDYRKWWQAGCRTMRFADHLEHVELAYLDIEESIGYEQLLACCDEHSVLVVDNICHNWERWHAIERDNRTGTTFDLYYCGIVFMDTQRYKHNYQINF